MKIQPLQIIKRRRLDRKIDKVTTPAPEVGHVTPAQKMAAATTPRPRPPRFPARARLAARYPLEAALKGIHPPAQRRACAKVGVARHKAHEDPANPYQLPVYDDPQARKRARRARQVDASRSS